MEAFTCDKCGDEITANLPGAVAFSPPLGGRGGNTCEQIHLCQICWGFFMRWVRSNDVAPRGPLPPVNVPGGPPYVYPEPTTTPWEPPPYIYPEPTTTPWKPPYKITCTSVPPGGSVTPR